MNSKPVTRFFFILLVAVMFSGCRTLPKPASNIDTLLIIPIATEKNSTKSWFGKYRITITNYKTKKKEKTLLLPIKDGFTQIRGLPPGIYYISESVFVYNDSSKRGGSKTAYILFSLYPNKITVLNKKFVYRLWDENRDGHTHFMNHKWYSFSAKEKEELIKSISDYKNFALWNNEYIKISGTVEHESTKIKSKDINPVSTVNAELPKGSRKFDISNQWVITVLDLSAENISLSNSRLVTDLLSSALISTEQCRIIDRNQRETILKELSFSTSGCADESCQLEMGKLLAADGIVVGSIGKIGGRYVLNIRLLSVETSEAVATSYKIFNSLEDLVDGSEAIAKSLLQ